MKFWSSTFFTDSHSQNSYTLLIKSPIGISNLPFFSLYTRLIRSLIRLMAAKLNDMFLLRQLLNISLMSATVYCFDILTKIGTTFSNTSTFLTIIIRLIWSSFQSSPLRISYRFWRTSRYTVKRSSVIRSISSSMWRVLRLILSSYASFTMFFTSANISPFSNLNGPMSFELIS